MIVKPRSRRGPRRTLENETGPRTGRAKRLGGMVAVSLRVHLGEASDAGESPVVCNSGYHGLAGVGKAEVLVGTGQVDLAQVLRRGHVEVATESLLEGPDADAGDLGFLGTQLYRRLILATVSADVANLAAIADR